MDLDGAMASKFVVGSAIGWMTLPSLCIAVMDKFSRILPTLTFVSAILSSVIMLFTQRMGEKFLANKI